MTETDRLAEIRARTYDFSHEGKLTLGFTAREDLLHLLWVIDQLKSERDALIRRLTRHEAYAEMAKGGTMKVYIVTHNDIHSGRDYSAQPEMLLDRWFLSLDEAVEYVGGHARIYQCDIGQAESGIVEWVNVADAHEAYAEMAEEE